MTSASLLIVLMVGTVVGVLTGIILGGGIEAWYLALLAGLLGSTMGAIARNLILARPAGSRAWPCDSKCPVVVILYAAVASLAASSLALEVADHSGLGDSPVLIGAMAGLFGSILLAMLMVTYYANPGEMPTLRSQH